MTTSAVSRSHKNFINGEWVPARGGSTFENRNPAKVRLRRMARQDEVGDFVLYKCANIPEHLNYAAWLLVEGP